MGIAETREALNARAIHSRYGGWNYAKIAKDTGSHYQTIWRIVNYGTKPRRDLKKALKELLGPLAYLFLVD